MEMENGVANSFAATGIAGTAAMAPEYEAGRMDSEVVGVVENRETDSLPRRIGLGELRDEDLWSIKRCVESLDYKETAERILQKIANSELAAFRLEPGLQLLESICEGEDKTLFVYWLEGQNMFRQLPKIKKLVFSLASAIGAVRLGAVTHDLRWANKLVKSFGGKITGYNVAVRI